MQLSSLIDPAFVQLGIAASDWRDAVRKSAAPMVSAGVFESAYVDDIISGAEEHGPYFVLTRGVAMPHGLPEAGVRSPALGICRLEEPVAFGNAACDPVRYLLPFGSTDAEAHLDALTALVDLISDAMFFETIDTALDASPVLAYVRAAVTKREEA